MAPHLLGGIFAWATLAIAAAAWAALITLLAVAHSEGRAASSQAEPMVGVLLLLLGVTILHAVPLPEVVASRLAPEAWANELATARGLGEAPRGWVAFSLDPGNTAERVLFGLAVLATFCTARSLGEASSSARVLRMVGLSTVLIALSQLVHELLEPTAVYNLYTPLVPGPTGPLINPNNRAGFMALGFPVCLGLGLGERDWRRFGWLAAAALVGATGLLARSRAGAAVLIAGPLVFALLHWWRKRRDHRSEAGASTAKRPGTSASFRVVSLSLALFAASWALARLANHDLFEGNYGDLTKLQLYRSELDMLTADGLRALLGVGRGAFSASFTTAYGGPGRALYAESLLLQYAIEFGVPLTVSIALLVLWRAQHRFWKWRSPAQLGGMVGIAAIAVQNTTDFSLELTGIAVPASACLAACMPRVRWHTERFARWKSLLAVRRASKITAVLGAVVLALCARTAVATDLLPVESELDKAREEGRRDVFWSRMRDAVRAHPAEASLASLAAAQLVAEEEARAPFWLNRAMTLAPGWPAPHLWAARWLRSIGRSEQALLELRLAADSAPNEAQAILCQWVAERPLAATVLAAAPERGPSRMLMLDRGADCLTRAPREAEKVDELILRENPRQVVAGSRRVRRLIAASRWTEAVAEARALQSIRPRYAQLYVLEAEALRASGATAQAVRALVDAPADVDERTPLLEALVFAQTAAKDETGLRQTIDKLRLEAAGKPRRLAAVMLLLGRCEASLGNTARAIRAVREAHRLSGEPGVLAEAAQLATSLGYLDFALGVWTQLCNERADSAYCTQRDDVRRRVLER